LVAAKQTQDTLYPDLWPTLLLRIIADRLSLSCAPLNIYPVFYFYRLEMGVVRYAGLIDALRIKGGVQSPLNYPS